MATKRNSCRRRRAAWLLLALLALGGASAPAADPMYPLLLWRHKSVFQSAPEPLAADIDLDRRYEIVLTAATHWVAAIEPGEGKTLWKRDLGNYTLLTPVTGHFTRKDRIDVVVASTTGMIFVLDGPTGQPLYDKPISVGFPLGLPPSVFPWTEDAPEIPYREGLLLYDPTGRLAGFLINGRNVLETIFSYDTEGALSAPAVVGETGLAAPSPHIAFVTNEGQVTVFSGREPGKAAHLQMEQKPVPGLGLTLGDYTGDKLDEIAVADSDGYLHAMAVRQNAMEPIWEDPSPGLPVKVPYRSILKPPKYPLCAVDVDKDGIDDILIPYNNGLALLRGNTGFSWWKTTGPILKEYHHGGNILSPPAVFIGGDGKAYAVFSDDLLNVAIIDLAAEQSAREFKLGGAAYITPLVGPIQGKGATDVFTRTRTDGGNTLIDLGIQFDLNSPPWLGPRGGATRTGGLAQGYTAYKEAQLELLRRHLDETIKQAKDMARQGKWAEASQTIATGVLAASPSHAEALRLHRYYLIREHLILIILVGLLALALLGWLVWAAWRISRRLVVENLARRAVGAGNQARAVRLYYRLCQLYPRRGAYYGQLADLLIELKRLGAEAAPIYEHAHAAFPGEDRYLKALATAYSAIPRFDEPAAIVYSEMARITKNAGPWFFILGQALMKIGRDAEALEAFRQAIVLHHEDPQLPVYMSDLFIRLGITAPEILSTLDRVLDQRQEDRAFLRTYCLACQEARRYDDQAQQVAEWLLAQDPASPPAHVILATRLLQTGLQKEAMLHAQQILQVAPNDAVGLRLLGACYAAEHRLDKTAMQIFAKALQANPDAPEILIAVSHGFIQDKRTDPEACAIYRKALVHNPNDETILGQLAAIAARENDDDLTIRTVEPLLEMGRQSRDLILQLANAYCRLGIVEDKAEPIYREALKHQPDHATIQDNLAAIYLRKGRTDAEATAIFELVYQRHPDRFDIGLQLVRCYHGAERPEKALELGRGLQALEPDNADLTKLLASASERADQMESAIAGYESVLTDHPDDHEAIRALSLLFGRKRLSDNHAIEVHNRAIQLEPNEPLHYLAAARAYAARESWESVVQIAQHMLTRLPGQVGEIIALLESLVEAAPKAFHLRRYLVDSLIFEGRLRDARRHLGEILSLDAGQADYILEALDRILEKNPKDAMAHLERGRLLLTMGRERDARRAIEQAHRYNPENEEIIRSLMTLYQKMLEKRDSAEVRFQLGRLAMRMDKYDLAISCFQQTSRDYRWEGESVRSLGRCFVAKGMLDLALQELKRLPLEHDVKEQLYELGQRYEAVQDIQGAREVYKLIFASDITFRDVKGKLETLAEAGQAGAFNVERTAIINSLSEEAKRRYELVQELGRGSMGIVYKARDNELDEFVALKILPDNLIRNTEAVRRFKQEARNARRLAHPNIVRIHDIGEELGRKYISMEFVEGTDLKNKLRQMRRKLPFATSLRYARQICEAMAYAHSIGIVHRDIKPANLMLTKDDQIKVTDFGIAKMVESTQASDATSTGLIIGTPLYMSPEQVKGQQVDHRADIYSIGVVFYEMASGYPPFTEGDLSYQHLFVEPKPLKGVPEPFATIVMKCLAKEKDQRPQRVQEILAELNRIDPSEIPFV